MPVLTNLVPIDKCRCGGGAYLPCPPGAAYGTWIPMHMVMNPPGVADPKTMECLQEALRLHEAHKPENVIYEGLDPKYNQIEQEWHDPERRSDLLERMANIDIPNLMNMIPDHMNDIEFLQYWTVRLRAYMRMLNDIAFHDLIPTKPVREDLKEFFTKF